MAHVAIFDLDRTLTVKGGFLPFAFFALRRRPGRVIALPRILVAGALTGLKIWHRDQAKALIWRSVLAGLDKPSAETLCRQFGETWARRALRPGAVDVLARHRAAGDRLILATAAMDLVAEPFGHALGFDEIVATKTGWTPDGRVASRFDGANCYGEEKLRRVREALGREEAPEGSVAYSDHVTDLPLLLWARSGVAVNPHKPLAAVAEASGLALADWGVAPAPGPR